MEWHDPRAGKEVVPQPVIEFDLVQGLADVRREVPRSAVMAVFEAYDDAEVILDLTAPLPPATVDGDAEGGRHARCREWHRKQAWCAQVARDLREHAADPAFFEAWRIWRQQFVAVLARRASEAMAAIQRAMAGGVAG